MDFLRIFILLLTTIISFFCAEVKGSERIEGAWSFSCEESTILKILGDHEAMLMVVQNQVYIKVEYKNDGHGGYVMHFSDTDELGMGGANFAWDSVSQTKELGHLKLIGDGEMEIGWLGFYDDVSKTYFLQGAPVFEGGENKNLLRCR